MLIIDAKYHRRPLQQYYGVESLISPDLYQIFTYVKNRDAMFGDAQRRVSGLLLYAKTAHGLQPSGSYVMSGNEIGVRTLDLNQPFREITSQLDSIAASYFEH